MSAAKSGYIAPTSKGGDGQTHATRFRLDSARKRQSYCGRTDSDDLIHPVAIFMTYANNPICRACVVAVEAEIRAKETIA